MMLTQMPKIGDKIRYVGTHEEATEVDVTIGKTYVIKAVDMVGDAFFTDDVGDNWYVVDGYFDKFELVAEPSEPTPVEASQSVIELLANISRRLYEAEQTIKSQAYEINELYKADAERAVAERG